MFPTAEHLRILTEGTLQTAGLVPWGSNYTFLMLVYDGEHEYQAIYKPRQGERPLWDFPTGTLCLRERAAYLVSEVLGWQIVPPTILRDGPRGFGSVQTFIEHDPEETYFNFQGQAHFEAQLQKIALFDIVTNNADRKGGHVIRDTAEHLWGIDHGLCFHPENKLRTVIWDYAEHPIPPTYLADMERLRVGLATAEPWAEELRQYLNRQERQALEQRLRTLLSQPKFITPGRGRHYPWPLV